MSNLIDKLKVPEFEIDKLEYCSSTRTCGINVIKLQGIVKDLTKEIEKRNRVIEKLIEQRDSMIMDDWHKIYRDKPVADTAAFNSIDKYNQILLSIIEGV